MRIQIITVTHSLRGGQIRKEKTHECPQLTLGRGTDQALYIPDPRAALAHARLDPVGGNRWQLHSLSPAGVVVNGKRQQTGTVQLGDRLKIGASRFTLVEPPAGHDAAIEVESGALPDMHTHPAVSKFVATRLGVGFFGLGRRSLAWLGFILILTAGLILPVSGFFQPDLQKTLRSHAALPDDHIWLTGGMFAGHQHLTNDCTTCHQQPFKPVSDPVCLECHASTNSHAEPPVDATLTVAELEAFNHRNVAAQQCANCHREHNGLQIIPAKQKFCSECHQDLEQKLGYASELPAATDFADHHPQFSTTLTQLDVDGTLQKIRVAVDDPALSEQSLLTFPHKEHLNPEGLETLNDLQVMECSDCHQPDASGQYMQPINFESNCEQCHQLNFDPSEPDRVVPHGKPGEVVDTLTEFYAELALRGASNEVRNIPVNRNDPAAVLLWARQQALRTGDSLFQGRACGECHQVSREQEGDQITWSVQPPRVAGIWFPRSSFDHSSHKSQQCNSCHEAETSSDSNDVLMPGIAICQDCHGGEHARNKVASTCIACHRFHLPDTQPLPWNAEAKTGTLYLWNKPDIERNQQSTQPARTERRRPGQDDNQ